MIEVHAKLNGSNLPSKKALKEALRDHPEKVTFTTVSPFNGNHTWKGDKLPGEALLAVGPDPQTKRNWYANVSLNTKGIPAVK